MSNDQKPVEINIFSPLGITILLAITVPIAAFVIVTTYFPGAWNSFVSRTGLARSDTDTSSNSSPALSTDASCRSSSGHIWTGVQLYQDSTCNTPIAVVLGGSNAGIAGIAGKALKLRYPDGSIEWKQRDAITSQTYIRANDPAIVAKQWQELRY